VSRAAAATSGMVFVIDFIEFLLHLGHPPRHGVMTCRSIGHRLFACGESQKVEAVGPGLVAAPGDEKHDDSAGQRQNPKDWCQGNGARAFGRDLQRPEVECLLRGGVGDALVGQGDDADDNQNDGPKDEGFHQGSVIHWA